MHDSDIGGHIGGDVVRGDDADVQSSGGVSGGTEGGDAMKKLLWSLVLVPCLSWGDAWLEMENRAGGKILFMKSECPLGKKETRGYYALATTSDNSNITGCWYYFAGMIHAVWENGSTTSYDPKDLKYREDK